MMWLTLIMGLIQAIPTIISVIKAIMDAIHSKPLGERFALEHELQTHLLAWHQAGGVSAEDVAHNALQVGINGLAAKLGVA